MADNLTTQSATLATIPASSTVATDDVGGVHYQRMKLVDGTDGATTAAKVSSDNALLVGTGPGFDTKTDPSNLGTAVDSAITVDVNGASTISFAIGTTTTGSFGIEGTADGTNWILLLGFYDDGPEANIGQYVLNLIVPQAGQVYGAHTAGYRQVRIRTQTTLGATVAVKITAAIGTRPMSLVTVQGTVSVSGGATAANQATEIASLSIIDDWDESDRAKVNLIAGQVGVQGASGLVSANTQRVVLATDVALPAGTNAIGKLAANSGVDIGDVDVTSLPALPAGSNNIGDVDVLTVPSPLSTAGNGTAATAHRVTIASDSTGQVAVASLPALVAGSANIGDVDVLTLPADPLGANADVIVAAGATGSISAKLRRATQGLEDLKTGIVLAAGSANIGDVDVLTLPGVGGLAAHAAPASGNPVYIAGRASTAIPTDVGADGDAAALWTNRNGANVVTVAPHVGLNSDPWNLVHEAAQYTSTQTSTVLVAGGASEKIVVTKLQIQAFGTTAFDLQVYFGTGAFARGTNRACFDGTFKPSTTLAPGAILDGPFIAGTNGDDLMVTTSAAGSVTINVWYYVVT